MKYRRYSSSLFLLTILVCSLVALPCSGQGLSDFDPGQIETANNSNDSQTLEQLASQLEALRQKNPQSAELRYTAAYLGYRRATAGLGPGGDKEAAMALLKGAQKELETLIDELPRDSAWAAESMTLASGIMGMRIGLEGSLGMSLGAKSGRLLARAARLSPDNPRVHLQQGISSFNTPEMWGGDKKEAETELRQAVALFAGQSDETKWPNWGYMDALAWLGQTLVALEKPDEARAVYQQALAINPEMGWIRYDLLPRLETASEK